MSSGILAPPQIQMWPLRWPPQTAAAKTPLVLGSGPDHATVLLGSNIGQVVYSHCLASLLNSKELGYKREYSDWIDLTA